MGRAGALTIAVALLAAACGSDGDERGGPPPTDATEPATTDATEPSATDGPPATEPPPVPTDATEPSPADPPATDAPPPTDPPDPTPTTEPPQIVNAVGLVPLSGVQLDFTAVLVDSPSLVWSLYDGSGGIIVENVGGPLPPGCHGTSFFDPVTFDLLQIDGNDLEAYAARGDGGCGGMQQEVGAGVVDGDATKINTDELILFDFGGLPADPFDVSTQVLNPDGRNGIFRSADPLAPRPVTRLDDPDLTHVIGADVLLDVATETRELTLVEPPPTAPGDCVEFDVCLFDRFGIDIVDTEGNPGQVLVSGDGSGLFTFVDDGEWQALVRIVNGCRINDHFWVFAAATSGVEFDLTVTDTVTNASRSYANPLDNLPEPITDTAAFATCP